MAAKNKTEEQIIRARVRMLLKAPFFGNLATRLILVDASAWCPTAGTDGKHFYYNQEFFAKCDKKEIEFVVAHEVMHCVYDHMGRRGSRDPRLWNCAGDYVINYELNEQRMGKFPSFIQVLHDTKYRGMGSEQVYELLKEDQKKGKGNGADGEANSFDMHMDPDANKNGKDGDGKTDPTGKLGPVPMTDEEREEMKDELAQAVMEAAKVAGAGNCPGGVARMINELTDPVMDWREILHCEIQSCFKSDFTFTRPNRKSSGIYILPGMDPDHKLDVDIAIDTSGSMGEQMLKDILSEVKGIMEQFADFTLRVWCFDTSVHNPKVFTPDTIDEIEEYELKGFGGTMFECNWEFMKEEEIEPHRLIVMTDGYPCGGWGDEDYCETFFLIHSMHDKKFEAPFGTTAHYEPLSD